MIVASAQIVHTRFDYTDPRNKNLTINIIAPSTTSMINNIALGLHVEQVGVHSLFAADDGCGTSPVILLESRWYF